MQLPLVPAIASDRLNNSEDTVREAWVAEYIYIKHHLLLRIA